MQPDSAHTHSYVSTKRTKEEKESQYMTSKSPVQSAREKDVTTPKTISPSRPYISSHGSVVKSVIDTGKDPHTATRIQHRPNSAAKMEAAIAALPWNDPHKDHKRDPLYRPSSRRTSTRDDTADEKESTGSQRMVKSSKVFMTSVDFGQESKDEKLQEPSQAKNIHRIDGDLKDASDAKQNGRRCHNFTLDLQGITTEDVAMAKSYDLSASGTMNIVGFQIKQEGLAKTPEQNLGIRGDDVQRNMMILSMLGKGCGGVVHKAMHVPTLQLVAVKVIPIFESEKRHQLVHELQTLYTNLIPLNAIGSRSHLCPYVVAFYDAFINPNNGTISIIVEYMDGGSLQNIVDTGGCQSEEILAKISSHVLQGLVFLNDSHQIHRDIKPSNLLIDHNGQVKISDFGITRSLTDSKDCAKTFVGTLVYMSPERISGEEYSYNSDVWSFGLSILTCALGKFPFPSHGYWETYNSLQSTTITELFPKDISPEFSDFLQCCLERDKKKRLNAKDLLEHPFIRDVTMSELNRLANLSFEDDEEQQNTISTEDYNTILDELDMILNKLKAVYTLEFNKKKADGTISSSADSISWLKSLSITDKNLLNRLASQTNVPKRCVHEKAKALLKELSETVVQSLSKS